MARPEARKEFDMAKIGSFKREAGEFVGQIVTLSVQATSARIVADEQASGNAPTHRIYVGDAEVGAGWTKRTSEDRPYLSLKLDDPSFVAPIFAQLFEGSDGEFDLVWTRPARRSGE